MKRESPQPCSRLDEAVLVVGLKAKVSVAHSDDANA